MLPSRRDFLTSIDMHAFSETKTDIGTRVTAVSVVRLTVLKRAFSDPTFDYTNSWGPAYAGIETNLAIVTASVPALRPLFARWLPQYFRNKSSGEEAYPATESGRVDRSKESRITRADRNTFQLKDMGETHTEIRGYSPDGSEEEIMTYNGIVRTTHVYHSPLPQPITFEFLKITT